MKKIQSIHIKTFFVTVLFITIIALQIRHDITAEISPDKFTLKTEKKWEDLGKYLEPIKAQEEQRAMIEEITFRSKEALSLKEIKFKWTGNPISENIAASLFKKKNAKDNLKLIEENVVGDGKWNPENQELSFEIDEKLIALNKYYLVLHFSPKIESQLKSGQFVHMQNRIYSLR